VPRTPTREFKRRLPSESMTDKTEDISLEPGWIPHQWRGTTSKGDTLPSPHSEQRALSASIKREDRLPLPSLEPESYLDTERSRSASQRSERRESEERNGERLRTLSRSPGPAPTGNDIELSNLSYDDADKNGASEMREEEPPVDRLMIERDRDRAVKYTSLVYHRPYRGH